MKLTFLKNEMNKLKKKSPMIVEIDVSRKSLKNIS